MTHYHKREITQAILDALSDIPVVVITGMRQVGKSTLITSEKEFGNRRYYNLDDFATLETARNYPERILEGNDPVTIDEVQRCPELLVAVKTAVDTKRSPGRFLLSGSANLLLLKNVAESLAGRAVHLTLHPLTRREIAESVEKEPFLTGFMKSPGIHAEFPDTEPISDSEILSGGFPGVCLENIKNQGLWFKGYEQTYLERDLRELSQVADLLSFRQFMHLTALRSGKILNISELARDARLNNAAASRYLNLLEISFVIQRVPPFFGNRAKRLIKSPKVYISDSGLAAYLTGMEDEDILWQNDNRGSLFETFAAMNLRAVIEARHPTASVCYWNIQGRHEIDFIVEYKGRVFAFEIKSATRWKDKDLASLKAFSELTPNCKAAVLAYNGKQPARLGEKLWVIPVGWLLS